MKRKRGPSEPDAIVNAMTVDVEDYFHVSAFDGVVPRRRWDDLEHRVSENTDRVLAVFEDAGIEATFFVLGWVAERYPALVRRIAAQGHEVASHGFAHRLVYDQTPSAFREDVTRAKRVLEDLSGTEVQGFRAPSYSITPRSLWALDILIEAGYRYDTSIYPIHHDRYGIPVSSRQPYRIDRAAGSVLEIPASAARVLGMNWPVGGGGYFRILPYAWTRWGLNKINRDDRRGAVFYLHPWEIDPAQPRLSAGLLSRFRHYRNLHVAEARLRRLLQDFRFGPIRQVMRVEPESIPADDRLANALPYLW